MSGEGNDRNEQGTGPAITPRRDPETEVDRDRVRNFVGLAIARLGPRAFEAVHGTFLVLLVGARTPSAFLAAFAVTAHRLIVWFVLPLAGRLSDSTRSRLGRRTPWLGGGLILMGLATWSYTVLDGYWPLFVAILVARIANTCRQLANIVVVPETFGRSRWLRAIIAIAIIGAIISLSIRVTVIATWDEADQATWNISFQLAALFMVGAGIAVLALIRDTEPARKLAERTSAGEPWRERIREILQVPNSKLLLTYLFLTVATSGAIGRLVPLFYREELGAGAAVQSTAGIVSSVLGLVISLPAGVWLSRRLTRKQLAISAPLVGSLGAAAHLLVTNIWQSVALGVVTGAFGIGAVIALAALMLQLLPRSGGMGERLGLSAGPILLVGVLSTYLTAITVDLVGSYRVMWLFPAGFGLVNAVLMFWLWIPPWAARVDIRQVFAQWSRRRASTARRTQGERPRLDETPAADGITSSDSVPASAGATVGDGEARQRPDDTPRGRRDRRPGQRAGGRSLFTGEVDVDDVDASVLFEMVRHAVGNPYTPPPALHPDEPAIAADARRVLGIAGAQSPADVTAAAELVHDDAVLVDRDEEHPGQPAVLEQLIGPTWEPQPNASWRLAGVSERSVTFQASPPPSEGDVDVEVLFDDRGQITRISRRVHPTLAQQADDYARNLGYPIPTPVDLSRPNKWRRRKRVVLTFWSIARHLGGVILRRILSRPIPPIKVARGLRRVFERLGGGYVKFGQLVASSPSLFGEDVSEEFRTTLDAGPVVPPKKVKSLISEELGRPFDELFSSFDPDPIGRASIAVVHKATTLDGRPVAVKVIRPGIEDTLATDLALMEPLFLRVAGPAAARLAGPLLQMLQGFRRQVSEELDLRNEAEAMLHYRSLLEEINLPDIVVPEPIPSLTARRVLTMELLDGVAIDNLTTIEEFGFEPAPLVEQVVKAWFLTAVLYGTFHGDVHAGNLMLLRDGRIAVIDWGIVGRLDPATHGFLRQLIAGALGEEAAWDEIAAFFGQMFGPLLMRANLKPEEITQFFRPRIEAILTQPFGEISLGTLISENQRSAAEADGELAVESQSGLRAKIRSRRAQARAEGRSDNAEPVRAPAFNRGLFLLGKQLMYFERYGRMYMQEVSLLNDQAFFEQLLRTHREREQAPDTGVPRT